MIDEKQTADFPNFGHRLELARSGNEGFRRQVDVRVRESREHFEKMRDDAKAMGPLFEALTTMFTKKEAAVFRARDEPTPLMVRKMGEATLSMVAHVRGDRPDLAAKITGFEDLRNTFVFRATLCCYLMALDRGTLGATRGLNPDKVRNSMVDMAIAAHATYFDGLLTSDRWMLAMYLDAGYHLAALGAWVPMLDSKWHTTLDKASALSGSPPAAASTGAR